MLLCAAETDDHVLSRSLQTLFFALNHSKGQSSLGRETGRINACACPPAPLAPTTGKCDCLWYDSSADQQVTIDRPRMQDAWRVENRLC